MTLSQDARYKAYSSALAHLKSNETIIAAVAALPPLVTRAGELLEAIVAADKRKIQDDKGQAGQKKIQHNELASLSFTVAQAIAAYAAAKKDEPLRVAVRTSRSKLSKSRSLLLAEKSANLLTKARELGNELEPYGVSAATADQLAAFLEKHTGSIGAPRKASAMRVDAGMQLGDLFAQLKQLLTRQVDPLVVQLKASHPDFYNQYLLLRSVAAPPRRKTRVDGVVKEMASLAEMNDATVRVKGTTLVTTTGPDGKFSLHIPNMKIVYLVIEKQGFKPVELQAQMQRGQATYLEVQMEGV